MRLQKKVWPHCAQCHSSSSQLRCCLVCLSSHTIDNDTAADRSLNGEQKGHKEGPDNEPRRAAVGAMFFFGRIAHCQISPIQTPIINQNFFYKLQRWKMFLEFMRIQFGHKNLNKSPNIF